MSDFWTKSTNQPKPWEQPLSNPTNYGQSGQPMQLDEQAMAELQEDPLVDIFEEDEQDESELMHDVNLRLEMGRLYQMILQNDIFADTNADPRAIKNVQREIRKLVREKMETMVGIRQERPTQETIISSPFNDMEVTVLKMLASKMSKGATEMPQDQHEVVAPAQPKKDGISSISGNLRPNPSTPLRKEAKAPTKSQPKQASKSIAKKDDEPTLQKPIDEMTPEELAAHDKAALERRSRNYAKMPDNMVPHPSAAALEMHYTSMVAQNPAPGSAVARMVDLIGNRN